MALEMRLMFPQNFGEPDMNACFAYLRIGLIAAAPLALSACAGDAFVDSDWEEIKAGQVAVCYHPNATTRQEVMALAQQACQRTGRDAQLRGETRFACRLLAPSQARFTCVGEGNIRAERSGQDGE